MPENERPKSMLDRFAETEREREILGRFVEWLHGQGVEFAVWRTDEQMHPAHKSSDELIADFLGIDLNQLEKERRALLEKLAEEQ